jgi:hypothetical protein
MKFKGENAAGAILSVIVLVCLVGMFGCIVIIILGENGLLNWYCPYNHCPEPNSAPYMGY